MVSGKHSPRWSPQPPQSRKNRMFCMLNTYSTLVESMGTSTHALRPLISALFRVFSDEGGPLPIRGPSPDGN